MRVEMRSVRNSNPPTKIASPTEQWLNVTARLVAIRNVEYWWQIQLSNHRLFQDAVCQTEIRHEHGEKKRVEAYQTLQTISRLRQQFRSSELKF
ncbi:unnamed protein product [Clavelina lepadiformis]|uniref:Uncharacterized protein n=1 Tax=Clavelina lepadiformis TaxID=159417 RepID=A0ABP0F4E6_CLALP